MDSQITTDVDTMFEDTFFTETVTHVNGSVTETIRVIFDDERDVVLSEIETSLPVLLMRTSDMTNVTRSSQLTRDADGSVYYPAEIGKDDSGVMEIKLTKNRP